MLEGDLFLTRGSLSLLSHLAWIMILITQKIISHFIFTGTMITSGSGRDTTVQAIIQTTIHQERNRPVISD